MANPGGDPSARAPGSVLTVARTTPTEANRGAWARPRTLRWFTRYEGWSDPGEQHAIEALAGEMAGRRILDIGVGGGRTVPLLRAISRNYIGIDFSQPMVDACGRKHPYARIELGDARDLGRFADGSFDLVVFSWNGIDAVDHEDRARIFAEVRRVLAPGGAFQFSTHNQDGRGWDEKPWTVGPHDLAHPRRIAGLLFGFPRNVRNHRRFRALSTTGDGWSMRNAAAHHFGLVIHYTTLHRQLDELAGAGFDEVEVRDSERGAPMNVDDDTSGAWWFQITARRRVAPTLFN